MRKLNMWKKHTEGGMNHDQANPKPRIMSGILHEKAELELERGNVASQLSAASSLLRLTCDAVIELDNDLRMTEDSPELAYMLMTLGVVVEQSASSSLVHASSRILSRSHAAESYPSCVDIFEDPPAFLISDCTPCALHRAIHARNPTKNSNRNTNSKPINPAHSVAVCAVGHSFLFFWGNTSLRRSGPGATLKGANFLDFMVPDDALRVQDILGSEARPSDSSLAISPGRQIMARAFHTRRLVKLRMVGWENHGMVAAICRYDPNVWCTSIPLSM